MKIGWLYTKSPSSLILHFHCHVTEYYVAFLNHFFVFRYFAMAFAKLAAYYYCLVSATSSYSWLNEMSRL